MKEKRREKGGRVEQNRTEQNHLNVSIQACNICLLELKLHHIKICLCKHIRYEVSRM